VDRDKLPELEAAKIAELNNLDRVEAAAWKAYERTSIRSVVGRGKGAKTVESKGDPKWLSTIQNCIRLRAEILQLLKPAPVDLDTLPPLLDIEVHLIDLDEPPTAENKGEES
jgi:hypothetical protein